MMSCTQLRQKRVVTMIQIIIPTLQSWVHQKEMAQILMEIIQAVPVQVIQLPEQTEAVLEIYTQMV